MSAFCTVGDVFADPEFVAPGNALLWDIGGLDDSCKDCTGFLTMPKRPYEWRVDAHGCYKFDNADLGFAPRDQTAHFTVLLHFRTSNLPGPDSITRSSQAQHRTGCWQERAQTFPQAPCPASRLESFGHAAQVQCPSTVATGTLNASASPQRPIGSCPSRIL